jgi:AAA domain
MVMQFKKATKEKAKARVAVCGPSGAGKTYTALRLATSLAGGGRVALMDTEHASASKYAHEFDFDVPEMDIDEFPPATYVAFLKSAAEAGYTVAVLDSISHAWAGVGGALEMKDNIAAKSRDNSYTAWRHVTPEHNSLVEAILKSEMHVIATMRSKMEYVQEGKAVRKIGMAPVQRAGIEYEFDVVLDMDVEHRGVISKTRCTPLDGKVINKPGEELGKTILDWLTDGVEPAPRPAPGAMEAVRRWAKVVAAFAGYGISEDRVLEIIKRKSTDDVLPEDLDSLRATIAGLKSGEVDADTL